MEIAAVHKQLTVGSYLLLHVRDRYPFESCLDLVRCRPKPAGFWSTKAGKWVNEIVSSVVVRNVERKHEREHAFVHYIRPVAE